MEIVKTPKQCLNSSNSFYFVFYDYIAYQNTRIVSHKCMGKRTAWSRDLR